jgi:hypothetical protein
VDEEYCCNLISPGLRSQVFFLPTKLLFIYCDQKDFRGTLYIIIIIIIIWRNPHIRQHFDKLLKSLDAGRQQSGQQTGNK